MPLSSAIGSQQPPFLLQGITGSGKTEVYLQIIQGALDKSKTAILLVPEISLTPQMTERFIARFGEKVAILHSGLSNGEKYDEWRKVERGDAQVVVGARSAIFAPLKNLGVMIIDEEHEVSYKQDSNPRYHAREVAILRAQYNQAAPSPWLSNTELRKPCASWKRCLSTLTSDPTSQSFSHYS